MESIPCACIEAKSWKSFVRERLAPVARTGDIRGICKIPAAHDPRQIVVQLIGEGPRLKLSISPLDSRFTYTGRGYSTRNDTHICVQGT